MPNFHNLPTLPLNWWANGHDHAIKLPNSHNLPTLPLRFAAPCSLLPAPCSLLPVPCSLFPCYNP
ncbi:MAG: hypothetical protein F6K50_26095 [Moorea sp. SIO3I7]|nr:hypothetical protein [Moorena sp. SIO3I7]